MRDGTIIAKSYANNTEAQVDKVRLEAEGFEVWVQTDNCDGMYPQFDLMYGVKLLVRQEDAAAVNDLLNPQATSAVNQPWDCPSCHEHIEAGFDTCWNCGVVFQP